MVNNVFSDKTTASLTFLTNGGPDDASRAETPVAEISGFGLRYGATLASLARRDRGARPKAITALPQGMYRMRRFIRWQGGLSEALKHVGDRGITLHESERWRLGVVRLGPSGKIPLHDHPGAFSVSHVLAGGVTVDAYSSVEHLRGVVRLQRAWSAALGPGQSAVLDPWHVNIHCLEASKDGAVLLTGIFAHGKRRENRRWFFSLGQSNNDTLTAVVVDQASARAKAQHIDSGLPRYSGAPTHG